LGSGVGGDWTGSGPRGQAAGRRFEPLTWHGQP
jgi:hypothetical protein